MPTATETTSSIKAQTRLIATASPARIPEKGSVTVNKSPIKSNHANPVKMRTHLLTRRGPGNGAEDLPFRNRRHNAPIPQPTIVSDRRTSTSGPPRHAAHIPGVLGLNAAYKYSSIWTKSW